MLKTSEFLRKFADRIEERDFFASKSDYGKLLIAAGSPGMAGAAYLSGLAAFRSGIGMVRYYGPEENRWILQSLLPEAMYDSACIPTMPVFTEGQPLTEEKADRADILQPDRWKAAFSWADYLIMGPGLSGSEEARQKVKLLTETDLSGLKCVVLDADALNILAEEGFDLRLLTEKRSREGKESNLVLTPHPGEMSRLTGLSIGEIRERPAEIAAAFSKTNNCTVVLKDAVSFVAFPDGKLFENDSGHAAMAKAGSGDVLTGVIAGLTAVSGGTAAEGAALGCFVHGKAGELAALYHGEHSILARDIADAVSGVIGSVSFKYDAVFEKLSQENYQQQAVPGLQLSDPEEE